MQPFSHHYFLLQMPSDTNTATDCAPAPKARSLVQAHLMEYPIYKSGHEAFPAISSLKTASFDLTRRIAPVRSAVDFNDRTVDGLLTTLDKWCPALKTTEVSDLTGTVTKPIGAAHLVFVKTLVEPTVLTLNKVRHTVHSHKYDANGRNVVLSLADPVVAPLNNVMEATSHYFCPSVATVPANQTSELARTALIVLYAVKQQKSVVAIQPIAEPVGVQC